MTTYEITANNVVMGEYKGDTPAAALDSYAQDAGYEDFSDLLSSVPGSTREELDVCQIDMDKLCDAVAEVAGEAVFQDSYGNGVALVKGQSYATHRELASAFGLELRDFYC